VLDDEPDPEKDYVCRHCQFAIAAILLKPHQRLPAKDVRLNIDGLRSHLLAKHGIKPIRSEDFFHYPSEATRMDYQRAMALLASIPPPGSNATLST